MIMLLWTLPVWVMLGCIASGRVSTSLAATAGLITAIIVAMLSGPAGMGPDQLALALQRGAWIGLTITPYILGGLAFWQMAAPSVTAEPPPLRAAIRLTPALMAPPAIPPAPTHGRPHLKGSADTFSSPAS